jgi:hypothetical protein
MIARLRPSKAWLLWLILIAGLAALLVFGLEQMTPGDEPTSKSVASPATPDRPKRDAAAHSQTETGSDLSASSGLVLAPAEQTKPERQSTQFVLLGTTIAQQGSIASLREVAGQRSWTVRTGDTINGTRVVEIQRDRVRLETEAYVENVVFRDEAQSAEGAMHPPVRADGLPTPSGQAGAPKNPSASSAHSLQLEGATDDEAATILKIEETALPPPPQRGLRSAESGPLIETESQAPTANPTAPVPAGEQRGEGGSDDAAARVQR